MKFEEDSGHQLTAVATRNRFGPSRAVKTAPWSPSMGSMLTASRNRYERGGSVSVIWTNN